MKYSLESQQKEICEKYSAPFLATPNNLKVGIMKNVRDRVMPINGLRHPPKADTSGWYIWAGQEYSNNLDLWVPLHAEHLKEWCPLVLKYLGLAPGWRFLINNNGYEDVWQDTSLLNI